MMMLRSTIIKNQNNNLLLLGANINKFSHYQSLSIASRSYGSKKDNKKPSQEEIDDKKDATYIAEKLDSQFPVQNYSSFYPGDPQRKPVVTQFTKDDFGTFRTRIELLKDVNNAEHQHGLDDRDYNIANFLSMDDDDVQTDSKREADIREEMEAEQDEINDAKLNADVQLIKAEEGLGVNLEAFSNLITRYDNARQEERIEMLKSKRRTQEQIEQIEKAYNKEIDHYGQQFEGAEAQGEEDEENDDDDDDDDDGDDEDEGMMEDEEGSDDLAESENDGAGIPKTVVEEEADSYGMEAAYKTFKMSKTMDLGVYEEKNEYDQLTDILNEKIQASEPIYTPRLMIRKRLMRVRQHTRVTKGGRINSYSALVLIGSGQGTGGIGYGKGESVAIALKRAGRDAERKAFSLNRFQDKIIPTGLDLHYRSTKIRFYRASRNRSAVGMIGHKQRFINSMFGLKGVNYRTYGRRGWRQILNVFQYALPDSWINPDELSVVLGKKFVTRNTLKEKKLSLANMLTSRIPQKESDPYNYGIIGKFLTDLEQPKDKADVEFDNMYKSIKEMLKSETSINSDIQRMERDPELNQKAQVDPMSKWKRSKYLAAKKMEQSRLNRF